MIVPVSDRSFSKSLISAVAALPDVAWHQLVDAHDQHFLVVRAIEDADLALARHLLMDAPQEVVRGLLGGRHLEARDVAALRVERAHHLANRTVLARRVHTLEHEEQRVLAFSPESVVETIGAAQQLPGRGLALVLLPPVEVGWVPLRKVELLSWIDSERSAQIGARWHESLSFSETSGSLRGQRGSSRSSWTSRLPCARLRTVRDASRRWAARSGHRVSRGDPMKRQRQPSPSRASMTLVVVFAAIAAACTSIAPAAAPSPTTVAVAGLPTVSVSSPANGAIIPLGALTPVVASATDTSGVSRIDLAVNGVVVDSYATPASVGQPTVAAELHWTPSAAGAHALSVVAYRPDGTPSAPAFVAVTVSEAVPPSAGPTLESTPSSQPTEEPSAPAEEPTPTATTEEPTPTTSAEPTVRPTRRPRPSPTRRARGNASGHRPLPVGTRDIRAASLTVFSRSTF